MTDKVNTSTEHAVTFVGIIRARLRRTARDATKALERRDEAIRNAATAGMSNREIAGEVGLSHTGVAKILSRPT